MQRRYKLPFKTRLFLSMLAPFRQKQEGPPTPASLRRGREPFPRFFLTNWVLGKMPKGLEITDRKINTRDGHPITLRSYRPKDAGKLPLVLNFHGGGWISGNLQNNDFYCAVLAKEVHCMVVSVDYRLAPEYKFPTPVNDALDAHAWVLSNAEDLGIDANRVCVTGDSAGGNLATVLCRKNCEQGGPPIHFQALIYPATDSRMEYESIDKHAHAPILTKQDIHHCIELYLDDPANMLHPDFSPMVADSLEMMPPAVVVTAGNDPLADDGRLYAERLQSSGVQAEWLHYPEDIHGFFTFPNHSKSGREAIYEVASKIKARFELLSA